MKRTYAIIWDDGAQKEVPCPGSWQSERSPYFTITPGWQRREGLKKGGWRLTHKPSGFKIGESDTVRGCESLAGRLTATPALRAIWDRIAPLSLMGRPAPFTPDEIALLRSVLWWLRSAPFGRSEP